MSLWHNNPLIDSDLQLRQRLEWRDDEGVTLNRTHHVTVQSKQDISLFLDGERVKVGKEAEISFVPDAVNVISGKPD